MSIESDADLHGIMLAGRVCRRNTPRDGAGDVGGSADDVAKIDVTAGVGGYIADAAKTIVLPGAAARSLELRDCAISVFQAGVSAARAGRRVSEIGRDVTR